MKYAALYCVPGSALDWTYQSNFASEVEFDDWMKKNPKVRWAHLVEIRSGRYVKSVHQPNQKEL